MLREFVATDEDAVHAYASDPLVTAHTVWGPNSRDDTRSFLADAAAQAASPDRRICDFAVVEQASQRLIGGAALRLTDPEHCRAELGYVIHRDFWSRGYATELAKALVRFGFDDLGLRRISATCAPDNLGSAKVLQKAGMVFEGRLRSHYKVRGAWRDSLLFAAVNDGSPG